MIPWRTQSVSWDNYKFLDPTLGLLNQKPKMEQTKLYQARMQLRLKSHIFLCNNPVPSSAPVTTPKVLQIHKLFWNAYDPSTQETEAEYEFKALLDYIKTSHGCRMRPYLKNEWMNK